MSRNNVTSPSINQLVMASDENAHGVEVWMKREDLIHPEISGNKWRKLKLNIKACLAQKKTGLISFGGAHSNHVLAAAAAAKENGLRCVLVIRGEKTSPLTPTLTKAMRHGAILNFVSRADYRRKDDPGFLDGLGIDATDFLVIPEGGSNEFGVNGCREILNSCDASFDFIACAQGTGGTAAGLLLALEENQTLLSFPALKGDFFESDIRGLYQRMNLHDMSFLSALNIITDYHFGGYAKWSISLIEFIKHFYQRTGIILDPIYTGKMMFGLHAMIEKGWFKEGSKVLAIHSGGVQGIEGFNKRFGQGLPEP